MYTGGARSCFHILTCFTTELSKFSRGSILFTSLRVQIQTRFGLRYYLCSCPKRTFCHHINNDRILDKAVVTLRDTFQCSEEEANAIVRALKDGHLKDLNSLTDTALLLRKNGLHKGSLIAFPWVLGCKSSLLTSAIPHLSVFHEDINVTVPLLQIPFYKLVSFSVLAQIEKSTVGNKIKIVSQALQCEPLMVSRSFAKYRFMLSLNIDRVLAVIELLKEAEIDSKAVLKDMWVFRHNIQLMKERVRRAKEAGILPLKPWSLRCEENVFNRMLERKVELLKVLGRDTSLEDYLSRKLDCQLSEVSYVHSKTPHVARSSCPRINRLLDYLYNEGFTPVDVVKMPRVLTRSLKTVQSRIMELQEMGFRVKSLSVVCKTRREYKEFISKLKFNRFTERSVSRIR